MPKTFHTAMVGAIGALALMLAACSSSDDTTTTVDESTTTTVVATTAEATTTTVDEEAATEAFLLAEAEALITAVESGDIETFMSMVQASIDEPRRLRYGFEVAFNFADYHDCEVFSATALPRRVDCVVTITDPVFLQFDPGDALISLKFWDDGVTWEYSGGGDAFATFKAYREHLFATFTAYREYFEANEPELYAATCVEDAYDQPVDSLSGFAQTPDCGAILHSKAADVAAWLDSGGG